MTKLISRTNGFFADMAEVLRIGYALEDGRITPAQASLALAKMDALSN